MNVVVCGAIYWLVDICLIDEYFTEVFGRALGIVLLAANYIQVNILF